MRLYYAQNKEDLLIKSFFPDVKKGFYIDVGANDPVIDSVTKLFYDEGWSGINIEPIEKHIKDLKTQRRRDINIQAGISNKPGKLKFREYIGGDGLSTFEATMQKDYESNTEQPTKNFKDYSVSVKTLSDVITENKVEHIHLMKIDVEGYEYEVIDGYHWKHPRPELLCIEANHIIKDWRPLLKKHRYKQVFSDGINDYYLAQESIGRQKFFNYSEATFAGNPVYYPAFLEAEGQAEQAFKVRNHELKNKLKDQEQQLAFLHNQQRDVRFLAKRLVEELQHKLNNRADGTKGSRDSLIYDHNKAIKEKTKLTTENKEQLLSFIHEQDRQNIRRSQGRGKIKNSVRSWGWKIAAVTFRQGVAVLKRIARVLS